MFPKKPAKRPERRLSRAIIDRDACADRAVALFNAGEYWNAHEALETIWRSVEDDREAEVLQGLIQAAAALLHRDRGNLHGVKVVGQAALEKLRGSQMDAIEFETVAFAVVLGRALMHGEEAPRLTLRNR